MMMIPAAAELLGMGNQGLPDFYFSMETSLESFVTWESWGTQVKFEFYYATITYFTAYFTLLK